MASLDMLRPLSSAEKRERVGSTVGLQTQHFFDVLLREVLVLLRTDPPLAESFAYLALEVATVLPRRRYPEGLRVDLKGEALTHVANCRRIGSDLKGAHCVMVEAEKLLAQGTRSRGRVAYWHFINAAILNDMGQFERALVSLETAAKLYADDRDSDGLALTDVEAASILLAAGRYEDARSRADRLLYLPDLDRRLQLLASGILVESLVRIGRIAEATLKFSEMKELQFFDTDTQPYENYLEASMLAAEGHNREAEKRFREAARGFSEVERYKDTMLCLITLFEMQVGREDYAGAIALCLEVLGSEILSAERAQIRTAWVDMLDLARRRLVHAPRLFIFRQYVQRCWQSKVSWPRFAEAIPQAPGGVGEASAETNASIEGVEVQPPTQQGGDAVLLGDDYYDALERREKELFSAAVEKCGYSVRATARALGMSRNTVAKKMGQFGLARRGEMNEPPGAMDQ